MAAVKRQKRFKNASTNSSWEQGRARKKKLRLLKHDLNERSNIALEWDDKNRSVVARREQIGLAWRDLIPFVDYVPHSHNILTDVLAIPSEIFDLENLKEVLSFEVWQTHLSENERNYLLQFLPEGAQTHQVVKELLAGDNFHFGNPLLKWNNVSRQVRTRTTQSYRSTTMSMYRTGVASFLLCIVHYSSSILFFFNCIVKNLCAPSVSMIVGLLMLKERWASCKDFAKEVGNKIWRFHDAEVDLETLSESGSWAADGEADNSYNQNLIRKHREPYKRLVNVASVNPIQIFIGIFCCPAVKSIMEDNCDTLSAGLKMVAIPRRGEKLLNQDVHGDDGFKYMPYIKASREQHQCGKSSMKESGNSNPSRSLNRALGNLDTFHVQMFQEEEWKKLHQHWVQLATRDLPLSCANRRMLQLRKWQLARLLEQEMEEKLNSLNEDGVEDCAHVMLPDLRKNRTSDSGATSMRPPKVEFGSSHVEHINDREEKHQSTIALSEDQQVGDHATAKPNEIPPRESSSSEYEQSLNGNRVKVALNHRSASLSYGNSDRSLSLIDPWPDEEGHGRNELLPLQEGAVLSFMK
ncbi:uncharacterized protein LOC127793480 isoform X2 [Diospyros lotus]|uniref:uncharacterized protein LOC127793480 isoform X2 n=1 Tax=Diospyros lotus TaxID=55363 RepID=UPI002257252A|nr:uncharacterized protein LOC127793480 isoform X2 [Diospyros lotus]